MEVTLLPHAISEVVSLVVPVSKAQKQSRDHAGCGSHCIGRTNEKYPVGLLKGCWDLCCRDALISWLLNPFIAA